MSQPRSARTPRERVRRLLTSLSVRLYGVGIYTEGGYQVALRLPGVRYWSCIRCMAIVHDWDRSDHDDWHDRCLTLQAHPKGESTWPPSSGT